MLSVTCFRGMLLLLLVGYCSAEATLVAKLDMGFGNACGYARVGSSFCVVSDRRYVCADLSDPAFPAFAVNITTNATCGAYTQRHLHVSAGHAYYAGIGFGNRSDLQGFVDIDLATGTSHILELPSSSAKPAPFSCAVGGSRAYCSNGIIVDIAAWKVSEDRLLVPPGGLGLAVAVDEYSGLLFVTSGGALVVYSTTTLKRLHILALMSTIISDIAIEPATKVLAVAGGNVIGVSYSGGAVRQIFDAYDQDNVRHCFELTISGNALGLLLSTQDKEQFYDIANTNRINSLVVTPYDSLKIGIYSFATAPVAFGDYFVAGVPGSNKTNYGIVSFFSHTHLPRPPPPPATSSPSGLPPPASPGSSSSGISTAAIVGIVLSCVIVLPCVVLGAWLAISGELKKAQGTRPSARATSFGGAARCAPPARRDAHFERLLNLDQSPSGDALVSIRDPSSCDSLPSVADASDAY